MSFRSRNIEARTAAADSAKALVLLVKTLVTENEALFTRLQQATAFVELSTGNGVQVSAPSFERPPPWASADGQQYDPETIASHCRQLLDRMALQ